MARIRTIKPEFWDDETIGLLPRDARLLFVATWNLADDEGLLRWTAAYLKASVFMYDDDIDIAAVEGLMAAVVERGLIFPYRGGKAQQRLAYVVNFQKHQRINRPSPSKLPPPSLQNPEVRQMYGRRDGMVCHLCKDDINPIGVLAAKRPSPDLDLSIDHKVPRSKGGSDFPSNVAAAHASCNKSRQDSPLIDGSDEHDSVTNSSHDDRSGSATGSVSRSLSGSLSGSALEGEGRGKGGGREQGGGAGSARERAPAAAETRSNDGDDRYLAGTAQTAAQTAASANSPQDAQAPGLAAQRPAQARQHPTAAYVQPSDDDHRPMALAGITNELVDEYAAAISHPLARERRARLYTNVDSLLDQGFTREQVREGLILLYQRPHLGAGVLPDLVHEAMSKPAAANGRASTRPPSAAARRKAGIAAARAKAAAKNGNGTSEPEQAGIFPYGIDNNVIDSEVIGEAG